MIDKGIRDKGFIWNPSRSECQCDKCDVAEYFDFQNWICRKKLVHKLVQECSEKFDIKWNDS